MTNAPIQRGRCEETDAPAPKAERGPDFRGAGHPCDDPIQMEEDLAVAGRGGADIREGTRGLERPRQVHGGAGESRAQYHRAQRLLPCAGPVP